MSFTIIKKDKNTKARLGVLKTPHGVIRTPSYVMVATHGQIKTLGPKDIPRTKTQIVISNAYHLWQQALKSKKLKLKDKKVNTFLTQKLGVQIPIMTDSGGFQIFSLGFGHENKVGKILSKNAAKIKSLRRRNIKITDKGVYFRLNGKKQFLGPKLSMEIQKKLGADIIFAFDECTSPLDGFNYNKQALARTHRWAKICLKHKPKNQMLFGIVQGGKYKSLRQESARFIDSLPFDGFGIGGSFGKDELVKTLSWVIPHLSEEKPRHLLGIGKVEDVFRAVENGIDLFDCVIPTREARHGRIYAKNGYYDIRKNTHAKNKLHKLFKGTKLQKLEGQRLATIHNMYFFNNFLEEIRTALSRGSYQTYKKRFSKKFGLNN